MHSGDRYLRNIGTVELQMELWTVKRLTVLTTTVAKLAAHRSGRGRVFCQSVLLAEECLQLEFRRVDMFFGHVAGAPRLLR